MKTVLVLGATGLFGGHLARQLIDLGCYDVICAGRTPAKLETFCTAFGGSPLEMNRNDPIAVLAEIHPYAVIDVAGPFQQYGADPYAFARSCLSNGAHYIDIADAPEFVRDIATLDEMAKRSGLCALSGASTTPALTTAVLDQLCKGMDTVDLIKTTILPGNQTPRGLSVMQAILGQVGQRFEVWENGAWHPARGWSRQNKTGLVVAENQLAPRPASLVNTPDTLLLGKRYNAKTVLARAGLELGLFHHSLRILRFIVQLKLLKSLAIFARPAHTVAGWFARLGSDSGGMSVQVIGQVGGRKIQRDWHLIAPDGHGPKIPVQPIVAVLAKIIAGHCKPGARPCLGEIPLAVLERSMAAFGAMSETSEATLPNNQKGPRNTRAT